MRRRSGSIPGYVLQRRLGRSTAGEVWAARVAGSIDDAEDAEDVAVSISRTKRGFDARAFRTGMTRIAGVEHPHLVRIHRVLTPRRRAVLVTTLADGPSLSDLLRARERLAPGEVVTAISPIADALGALHAASVVHGGITPSSILLLRSGYPLLSDAGVAGLLHGRTATTPTQDVRVLAAVAIRALIGGNVDDPTAAAVRMREAGIPDELAAVLCRAMDPDDPPPASRLGRELRQAVAPEPIELGAALPDPTPVVLAAEPEAPGAPTADGPAPATEGPAPVAERPSRVRRRARRRRLLLGVAVSVVLAGAGGAAWAIVVNSGHSSKGHTAQTGSGLPSSGTVLTNPVSPVPTSTKLPGVGVSGVGASPTTLNGAGVASTLQQIDVLRQHAFATRTAVLLTGVWAPGPLLDADKALLDRLVPEGCGLQGVTTIYRAINVLSTSAGYVQAKAQTQLQPSVLVCNGKITAQAAIGKVTTVVITLVQTQTGWVIADVKNA